MNPPMETWMYCLPLDASRTLTYECVGCGVYRECKGCRQECLLTILPHYYVCIELDIREDLKAEIGKTCRLEQILSTINLGSIYRLTGVIGFTRNPNHFIAYCRRADIRWEIHNDCDYKSSMWTFKGYRATSSNIHEKRSQTLLSTTTL
ncbi:uncharacterized protein LOC107047286 isoform X2 [Diachasma alloeum]|nr:uncharacterized protein LOC107047286 isoform X2 [Diachasma alloeum]